MAKKDGGKSVVKKTVYVLTSIAAAGTLAAAISSNIGFMSADFDPSKYSRPEVKKDDNIVFDGVAYSNGGNKNNQKKQGSENKNNQPKDEEEPVRNETTDTAIVPVVAVSTQTDIGAAAENVSDTLPAAGVGDGVKGGYIPVISEDGSGNAAISDSTKNENNKPAPGRNTKPSGGNNTKSDETPANNGQTEDNNKDVPEPAKLERPVTGGGGNSGGNLDPVKPPNTNPS